MIMQAKQIIDGDRDFTSTEITNILKNPKFDAAIAKFREQNIFYNGESSETNQADMTKFKKDLENLKTENKKIEDSNSKLETILK
jgi:hypothetical protein